MDKTARMIGREGFTFMINLIRGQKRRATKFLWGSNTNITREIALMIQLEQQQKCEYIMIYIYI